MYARMLFFFVLIQKRTPDIASLIGTGKKNQGEIEVIRLAVGDGSCDFAGDQRGCGRLSTMQPSFIRGFP